MPPATSKVVQNTCYFFFMTSPGEEPQEKASKEGGNRKEKKDHDEAINKQRKIQGQIEGLSHGRLLLHLP